MHIFYVIKSCISNIYKRKLNFVMTTIVFFISFYMIMVVSNCYFSSIYTKLQLTSKLKGNKYISVKLYDPTLSDEKNKIYLKFIKFLNDEFKDDFGVYYFTRKYIYDEKNQRDLDVIAVNDTLFEINNVNFKLRKSENKKYIYLPESLKGNVNDKIIVSFKDNKDEYIIEGFMDDDLKIIDDKWNGSDELFIDLCNAAIINFDWDEIDLLNPLDLDFPNYNIFIRYENEEDVSEIKNTVFNYANKYNINLYVNTFDELLYQDMESNMAKINEIRLLLIVCFVVAFFSALTAGVSDIISRGKYFSILQVVGISPFDIGGMIVFENLIKNTIAFGFASFFMKQNINTDYIYISAFKEYTFWITLLIMISMVLFLSFVQYKNVRKDGLLKSIGENKL